MSGRPLLALVGPTASGKSRAGLRLAEDLGCEIVSVDSMLVYRGMDIGTAKPSVPDRARVRHHLIDVVDPSEPFSVMRFQREARAAVRGAVARGRRSLLVGGSGLYLRAVVDDLEFPETDPATRGELEREAELVGAAPLHGRLVALDPMAASKIGSANVRRTVRALEVAAITGRPFSEHATAWDRYPSERVRAAGVRIERGLLMERIRTRVAQMIDVGWLEEVRGLAQRGFGGWLTATQAIGYAELVRHLRGELALDDAVAAIVRRTGNLARRQMAWFARDPRIRWFEVGDGGATEAIDPLRAYLEDG